MSKAAFERISEARLALFEQATADILEPGPDNLDRGVLQLVALLEQLAGVVYLRGGEWRRFDPSPLPLDVGV